MHSPERHFDVRAGSLHELQCGGRRHAPQRDEKCEGRRQKNNRSLERGSVHHPPHDVRVHVVTQRVTRAAGARFVKIAQLVGCGSHG